MNLFFYLFFSCVCVFSMFSRIIIISMLLCFVCVVFFSVASLHFFSFTQRRSIYSCHFTFIGNCSVIECDMIAMIVLTLMCTLFFCLLPVFFMGISIAFCFYDFQLFSLSYFSSSGVKMLFNDIRRKKIWLKSNCESCCVAHDYIGMYVLLRVLLDTFNLDDVPLKTGFQSIQTIGNKIQ